MSGMCSDINNTVLIFCKWAATEAFLLFPYIIYPFLSTEVATKQLNFPKYVMSPQDQVVVSFRSDVKAAIQRPLYKYNPTSSPVRTPTPASTNGGIHPPLKHTYTFPQIIILSKISSYWVKI